MSTTGKVVTGVIIVAVIAAGIFYATRSTSSPESSSSASTSQSQSTTPAPAESQPVAATITFTGNSFSPADITVKAGDTIRITNGSSQPLQMDSDPHPVHNDEPELNVGEVDPGKSATFTVTKVGTWGYHDHLSPDITGTIHVQ